jgi:hypothetical protein
MVVRANQTVGDGGSERTQDPQFVVRAQVKASRRPGSDSEVVAFSLWSGNGLVETVCIVPIPDADKETVNVFCKVKVHQRPPSRYLATLPRQDGARDDRDENHGGQTPADKQDARED